MVEDVRQAIATFVQHQSTDDETLCAALVDGGRSRTVAEALTVFMPIAFARVLVAGMGVRCPPTYRRPVAGGQLALRRFATQPVFMAATEVASTGGVDRAAFLAVAGRSAEFKAVNGALHAGSRPENLLLAEPIVMWPVEEMRAEPKAPAPPHPDTPARPAQPPASAARKGWLARLLGG